MSLFVHFENLFGRQSCSVETTFSTEMNYLFVILATFIPVFPPWQSTQISGTRDQLIGIN